MSNKEQFKERVIVIGHGETGGVFSRAILRASHSVIPITREKSIRALCEIYAIARLKKYAP